MTHNPLWLVGKAKWTTFQCTGPNKVLKAEKPVKVNDSNSFSLVGGAGDVDMRNVGVVASDHACDQKPRLKQEKERQEKKRQEKKKKLF